MAIIDASSSTRLSSGAGRSVDVVFPDPLQTISTATACTQWRSRLNNTTGAMAQGGFGGGGATLNVTNNIAGMGFQTLSLIGGGADGNGQLARYNLPGPQIFQTQIKGHGMAPGSDPYAANRVWANYAYIGNKGANVVDSGLQMTLNGPLLIGQAAAGVAFVRRLDNTISATTVAVAAGAAVAVDVTGAGTLFPAFSSFVAHTYEFRIVSATVAAEAFIQWVIDGVVVLTRQYGAGSVLPTFAASATFSCFTALVPHTQANTTLLMKNFCVVSAPTLLDTF